MYDFYLDRVLLPVAPSGIQLRIKNQNRTITLINEGEVNLLKSAGLTEISFTALFPQVKYPFAKYKSGFRGAAFFLGELEKLKTRRDSKGKLVPFQFIVSRAMPGGRKLFDTNMQVALEDYVIEEDKKDGFDLSVNIRLKQFRPYGTKIIQITDVPESSQPVAAVETQRPAPTAPPVGIGSSVIVNGTLHRDSYGDAPGRTLSNYNGKINFINMKGSHPYHVTNPQGGWLGWVLASAVRVV
jgi:hypothetical protein